MKNLTILIIAILLTSLSLSAQKSIGFGVKAGANFSKLSGDFLINSTARTGFHIGGFVDIPFTDKLSFKGELLYSQRGNTFKGPIFVNSSPNAPATSLDSKITQKLDYLSVPLLASIKVIPSLSFEVGPQLGLLVSNTLTSEVSENDFFEDGEGTAGNYNDFDVALSGGATFMLESGLLFQARYVFGITDITPSDVITLDNQSFEHRVIQLSVGYKF